MENLYRLRLKGITYNQIESGVYALILEHEESGRRLPIIIGYPEAQAIECKLQEINTPRPLTHDLMVNVMGLFGITLKSVVIRKLPDGVFAADLTLETGGNQQIVDSRSSDAVALAIRVGAPIYTTADVLDEAGFMPDERGSKSDENGRPSVSPERRNRIRTMEEMDLDELNGAMQKAVAEERYEDAARIKGEIAKREGK